MYRKWSEEINTGIFALKCTVKNVLIEVRMHLDPFFNV
jgi:hypothetical protein